MSDIDNARPAIIGGATLASGEALAQSLPKLGPNSTGVPGPGAFGGGRVDFTRLGIKGQETFGNFGCTVFREDPATPDWATANVYFERGVHNVDIKMPDGRKLRCWAFEDTLKERGKEIFPSPLIRVQEGDLVHVKLSSSKGSHTIHHHGIEPTTMNDGVGHVSFETNGSYIYQWQPRHAGTWFYHCHKNTVTHFEMGLYGLLIVDPKPNANGKVPAFAGGPEYDKEAMWVLDDMDPRWHEITNLDHDVGLCGTDAGLNIFEPKYFLISGTPTRPGVETGAQKISVGSDKKLLIRLLNASYSVLKVTIKQLQGQVISVDGHALNKPWNKPFAVGAGEAFYMPTARRYDILIDMASPANAGKTGKFPVEFEFQHWITRNVHNAGDKTYEGRSFTTINV